MQFHCPNLVATASQHVPSGYEGENRLEAGREYVRIYGRLLAFVLRETFAKWRLFDSRAPVLLFTVHFSTAQRSDSPFIENASIFQRSPKREWGYPCRGQSYVPRR